MYREGHGQEGMQDITGEVKEILMGLSGDNGVEELAEVVTAGAEE